jgi:glycosyltransferase involved in cell wall biosynthesis
MAKINNNKENLRVLFSKPMTFRGDIDLPPGFNQIFDESRTTFELSKKYGYPMCDYITQAKLFFKLLVNRHKHDVIITGRFGDFFTILQALIPIGKKPYLLLEPEWMSNHSPGIKKSISLLLHKLISRGTAKIQVICEAEADNYSKYYGISRDKFVWIPYSTNETDEIVDIQEKDYIFSGGRNQRDWKTLYHAVKDLDIEVRIVAPKGSIDERYMSNNMTLLGRLPRDEYFKEMASARLVVLSLEPDIMRYPGVITYVYSMRMGKCTIVNEPIGAKSYIEEGKTGFIVNSSDPLALQNKIEELLNNHELRREIGRNASHHAKEHYSLESYLDQLSDIAHSI